MAIAISVGYSDYIRDANRRNINQQIQTDVGNRTPVTVFTATSPFIDNFKNNIDVQHFNIFKQPREHIQLEHGGVLNDSHFRPPCYSDLEDGRYLTRWITEVNLFTIEELGRLNSIFGTNVTAGGVGENILTKGIDLDALPANTILKIGSTATIEILARRTFCFKLANVFLGNQLDWVARKQFDLEKIGVTGQVVTPGVVYPGDAIEVMLPKVSLGPMPVKSGSIIQITNTKIS